jgi:hypothetical protein
MVSTSDFLHLRYTRDLTEGGIAYALRSLPYGFKHAKGSLYERLQRVVAGAAVDLAFRRYLSEQNILFDVKRALPFTERDRYDVTLAGRRCEVTSFLIRQREQILQIQRNPELLLKVPALIASDQHAAEGNSPRDLYLFAFFVGEVKASQQELGNVIEAGQPHYVVHVMPEAWNRPSRWNPLGTLVLKSDSEETQIVEIGGQDEGRALHSLTIKLPPRTRLEVQNEFFSLAYIHTKSNSPTRIGIHSPARKETHLIDTAGWGNIWIYGLNILMVGYLTREEFSRHASFLPTGSRVFQYNFTQVKNLAVPISKLRPLSELLERSKIASAATIGRHSDS